MSGFVAPSLLMTVRAQWQDRWSTQRLLLPGIGIDTAAGWLHRVRGSAGPAQDVLLSHLLDAAADGEQVAEQVLMQLLIPPVDRAVARVRGLGEQEVGDRAGIVIAAVWETIRCAPAGGSPRHRYVTLVRVATARLTGPGTANQRQIAAMTQAVDPAELIELAGPSAVAVTPAEVCLAHLFTVAVQTGAVTVGEVRLLQRTLLEGRSVAAVARAVGVSPATLRRRVLRITANLQQAVGDWSR